MRRPRICVVCPCYNEEAALPAFHRELDRARVALAPEFDVAVIFVDDGSTDGTLAALNGVAERDPTIHVYSLSRNFGKQAALAAGLRHARGDAVIVMDCDLQHPPALLPALIARWRDGFDVVAAIREQTRSIGWAKRMTSALFHRVFNGLCDTKIAPGSADFYLLSRRAHRALRRMPERHRFLRGLISWMGFPRTEVRFVAPPRVAGQSKYTLDRSVRLALDALLSFATRPVRWALQTGLVLGVVGVLALAYLSASGSLAAGWPAWLALLAIFEGFHLALLGLVGESVRRAFEESKRRPLYIFKQPPSRRRSHRSGARPKRQNAAAAGSQCRPSAMYSLDRNTRQRRG